jgi:hypothetical protein
MSRNLKIRRAATAIIDTVAGCRLVPLSSRKEHYVSVQPNVLPNTFYRVIDTTDIVRAMVTIMPDGTRVAWDTCGKCHLHVGQCECKSGVYHPSSVGWIRATCDNTSYQRITDYSMYHDPYMQLSGDSTSIRDEVPAMRLYKKPDSVAVEVPKRKASGPSISGSDIENMDMAELDRQARKQAKSSSKKVSAVVRKGK